MFLRVYGENPEHPRSPRLCQESETCLSRGMTTAVSSASYSSAEFLYHTRSVSCTNWSTRSTRSTIPAMSGFVRPLTCCGMSSSVSSAAHSIGVWKKSAPSSSLVTVPVHRETATMHLLDRVEFPGNRTNRSGRIATRGGKTQIQSFNAGGVLARDRLTEYHGARRLI